MNVLLVGESVLHTSILQKGFDTVISTKYTEEATGWIERMRAAGHTVDYVPCHGAATETPDTVEGWNAYDVVVLSDVGSNSFLLGQPTMAGQIGPNRLSLIAEYVAGGGGLVMVGGWMSFAGIEGKARYGSTPLAAVLPVVVSPVDDRVERPEGVAPAVATAEHPAVVGLDLDWPPMLGYNALTPRPEATVVLTLDEDPLLTVGSHGDGRVAAYASDITEHWVPGALAAAPSFAAFWDRLLRWCGGD